MSAIRAQIEGGTQVESGGSGYPGLAGVRAPLDAVIATSELRRRDARPPDFEAENLVLASLIEEMSRSSSNVLQKLVETALELCSAHSAGISILEQDNGRNVFRWRAVTGRWAGFLNGTMPREISPCGTVLDRNHALLMFRPQRHFPFPVEILPEVEEVLLIPFHVAGQPVGTIWVVAHDESRKFDAEDERLLNSLAKFASLAQQVSVASQQKAQVAEQLVAELADTKLLQDLSAELIHSESDEMLFEKIMDAAVAIMRSDFASMQMLFPERGSGGELKLLAFRGFNPQAAEFWTWVRADSASTCGVALRTAQRVVVPDIEQCDFMVGTDDLDTYRQTAIRAVQTTPLLARSGRLVGMISTHWRQPHEPSQRDLRLLDILARQAADLMERQQVEQAQREGETRFRAMIDALPAAVYTTDAEGRLTHFNPAAVELSGRTPELGTDHWCVSWKLYNPDGTPLPHDKCPMAISLKTGQAVRGMEAIAERPDGTRVWFEPYPTPLFDERGRLVGGINMLVDITERKQAEQARSRLAAIVESSDDAIISKDLNGTITSWNRGAEVIFGYTAEEAIGQPVTMLIPPDRLNEEPGILERIRRKERIDPYETLRRRKDGKLLDVSLTVSPVSDAAGNIVGASKIARDITQRKRAEEREARQQQTFADLVERAPFGLYIVDSEFRIAHINADSQQRAFRNVNPAVGHDFADAMRILWPEPVATEVIGHFRHTLDTGHSFYSKDYIQPRADIESVESYEWELHRITLPDGQFGVVCYYFDSTRLRQAEQALRRSEQHLELVSNSVPALISYVGKDGRYRSCNKAYTTWFGLPVDQIVGRPMRDLVGEKAWEVIGPHVDDALAGNIVEYEAEAKYRSGTRWIHAVYTPHRNSDGAVEGMIVMVTDITQRKHADDRLRLLWEAASVLLTTENPDAMLGKLFDKISPHMELDAYFNFMVDEGGKSLSLASCSGVSEQTAHSIARIGFGQSICGTVALQRRPIHATHIQQSEDSKAQWVKSCGIRAYACNPLMSEGRLLGTLSFASRTKDEFDAEQLAFLETICQYVTVAYERLRLLNQLKEADRRKDEFLATLAHELRNPLNPIRNAVESLRIKGPENAELQFERDVIDRQVEHLTRLIDDLLDINRIARDKLELRRQPIELEGVVQAAIEMSRPLIDQWEHQLSVRLPESPVWLDGDPARLSQVLMNLLNNAAKYTEPGGQIWIDATRGDAQVEIAVTDTGIGIAPEKIADLFEIFYQADRSQTRSQGGLGIGLSLVRRLVEMHGGSVTAHSEGLGMGSQFVVRLPMLAEAPNWTAKPDGAPANPVAGRRFLVVDDNQDSARMLAALLRLMGNEVELAFDGVEALATLERYRPEVVLLDLGMPRLNGYDTCRRIRQQPWGRDVLLIAQTGWGQNEDKRRTKEAGFDAHFVKPVTLAAINQLLDEWRPVGK